MPIARFQMPDGRIGRFEVPEGTTPEQAQSLIAAQVGASSQIENDPITQGAKNFAGEMSGGRQFAAGMGKAFTDLGRGGAQLFGFGPSGAEVAEQKAQDAPLMQTGAGVAGNIAGNLAPAVATAAIPGANTITGGALAGTLLGGLQPTENLSEKGQNVIAGGVLGGAVPAALRAYQVGKAAVEPFYEGGQKAILSRALNRVAGDNAGTAQRALSEAGQPFVGPQRGAAKSVMGELVPGSMPTAGDVSGNAGIAAMQRASSAANPTAYAERGLEQNAARVRSLENIAGDEGQKAFFETERAATAKQLYDQAYAAGIDPKLMTPARRGEITKLMQRPAIQSALADARELAANEGMNLRNPAGSVKGLDYLKRALDDQIGNAAGNEQRVLINLRDRLLTTIDTLSPEYAAARKVFAQMSPPINRMEVGEELLKRGTSATTDALGNPTVHANKLAQALRSGDMVAQKATGFGGATLEKTLTQEQLASVRAVVDDLSRGQVAQNLGRGAGSDTVQKLAMTNMLEQSGVPTWMRGALQIPGNLAARGAKALYGDADRQLVEKLSQALLSPKETADLMARVPPNQRAALSKALQMTAGAGLMSLPGQRNALQ